MRKPARRPSNLIAAVDERISLPMALGMGVQHCFAMSSGLVLAALIAYAATDSVDVASNLVRISMIAAGLGTILQSLKRGPIGSGYLCPNLPGPTFYPASLLAAQTGGLSLVFGMTFLAGLFQALLSRVIHRLRALLPPEVTGVIVAMVGISLIGPGISSIAGIAPGDTESTALETFAGVATLLVMFGLSVWGTPFMRLYCVLIGVAFGYALEFGLQIVPNAVVDEFRDSGLFSVPDIGLPVAMTFDASLILPFLIAGIASTVKAVGDLSTAQKINDEDWVAPEMTSIRKGVLADALAVVSSAVMGGMGQSTSSSNLGVALATGVTSRWIGFSAGAIFILAAFIPALAHVFVLMPGPVKGAVLVFVACFMIVSGMQLVMSRLMDTRKTFVVGASIIAGLSVDVLPSLYADLDPTLGSLAASSLSLATVTAIGLNLVFRIGVKRRADFVLEPDEDKEAAVVKFLHDKGALWGARRDIIQHATTALVEFVEAAARSDGLVKDIRIDAHFDQFRLDIFIHYTGPALPLPEVAPSLGDMDDETEQMQRLSGFLIRSAATKAEATRRENQNTLHLLFDH